MSTARARSKTGPTPDPVGGQALTASEAADRLGQSADYVHVRLKRKRDGHNVRVAFPEPEGEAIPDTGYQRLRPYWREVTVIEYGRAARLLDGLDRPKKKPTPEGDR